MIRKHPIWMTVLAVILLLSILGMQGCASPADQARTLLDRLEFGPDEYGSFELEGTIDFNPLPLLTSNAHLKLEKYKDKPGQGEELAP